LRVLGSLRRLTPGLPGRRPAAAALVLAFLVGAPAAAQRPFPQAPSPPAPPRRLANSVDAPARAHLRIVPDPDRFNLRPTVAGAGDVNGDGLADLVVGVSPFGCEARPGTAYVIYGTREPATVDLRDLGARGFAIRGTGQDALGDAVDGAGDVNGDGLADLVIGAPAEGYEGGSPPGEMGFARGAGYVIFGKRGTEPVDVTALGDRGYRILGPRTQTACSKASRVAGLGDVNGDGRADVLLAPSFTGLLPTAAAVVFGRQAGDVSLDALGEGGYELRTARGGAFGSAGDVNGDGLGDVVVGEPRVSPPGACDAGRATVLFGGQRTGPVSVGAAGGDGIAVVGAVGGRPGKDSCSGGEALGSTVAAAGDLDGDGLGDVLLGGSSGSVVLRGRRASGTVDVSRAGTEAVRIAGLLAASGAGDVDGDGRADVTGLAQAVFSVAAIIPGRGALTGAAPFPPGPGGWLLRSTRAPGAPTGVGDVDGDGRGDVAFVDTGDPSHGAFDTPVLVVTERPTLASGRCANVTSGTDGEDMAPGSDAGDRILGYAAGDRLAGFGGDDCLVGGAGGDALNGGDGDDRLEGGDDHDTLTGDAGSDVLSGGRGRDRMFGGPGDDAIDAADGAIDRVDCGPGVDRVRADVFDRLRGGCERRQLLAGRPRRCVIPRVRLLGPRRARVGEPVILRVAIEAPSLLESGLTLFVSWGSVDVVGPTGNQSYPGYVFQGRKVERLRFRYRTAGRFRARVTAAYQPSPGCGAQPEYVMPPPVLIRVK